ncbi:glycosyltransferase [Thiovulum sp. ES]|nr:glycosyltransferase [Thiovulum sp. ES]
MKIGFLSSLDLNLYLFRLDIMKRLLRDGHEVIAIVPHGDHFDKIGEIGVKMVDYSLSRGSLSPISATSSILELSKILKSLNLDLLHTFTVKPNIFGTFAGKIAGVPKIVNLVEGLGSFYIDNSLKSKIVRKIIETSYKISFRFAQKVIFVNSDDPEYLESKGIIPKEKIHIIKSVGVDTDFYQMKNVSDEVQRNLRENLGITNQKVIIMIARAILHKGTLDFYKSAEILKEQNYKFLFVGGLDEGNKFGMSRDFMNSGNVNWLDFRNDIRELIAISDLVVLPSYREGVPRTLLEASSMGKPIIGTDVVGVREAVDNGENGFLIPIESPKILSEKISQILENENLQKEMSDKSRQKAVSEFEIQNIVEKYIKFYSNII